MKDILAFSAGYRERVLAGPAAFSEGIPLEPSDPVGFDSIHSEYGRGQGFLLFDSQGFASGRMDVDFLKNISARGKEIWICTPVRDLDDLFDAFSTGIDYLVAPLPYVASDSELEEMHGMSDALVPAVFATEGRPVAGKPIDSEVTRMARMGFESVAVIDTDGHIPSGVWDFLFTLPCEVIPYSKSPVGAKDGRVFTDPYGSLP